MNRRGREMDCPRLMKKSNKNRLQIYSLHRAWNLQWLNFRMIITNTVRTTWAQALDHPFHSDEAEDLSQLIKIEIIYNLVSLMSF